MIIQLADVHFGYPGTEIFEGLSFQINPGERIGLVGPNGAGKSTLLRLMAGLLHPDRGQVARARNVSVAYLHQSQEFQGAGTLWDTLMIPFAELLAMRRQLGELEHLLSLDGSGADHARHLEQYGELQEIYTRRGGYTIESSAKILAHDLGFEESELGRSVDTLSGGERGRLELAKVLLAQPDLLLLDEPTNHLDLEAVEHLEERLREWPTAFLLVSHDRFFLRAVCREIVDVEDGTLVRYPGGYDKYVVEREERLERMNAAFEKQQEKVSKTEDFIRRNLAGQKTKQAQSRRKMLEKLERLERPRDEWADAGEFKLRFATGEHLGGKEAIRVERLSAGYPGASAMVRDLDLTIYRGERLGIIGPNGAGKSTLLKTLLGRLDPLGGHVFRGHEVRVGYYDQKLGELDENRSLIEEIRSIRGDFNEDVARSYLGRFRFSGDDGFRKVKGLSGGERSRLALGKLMLQPRNLLALDEPTNHLDIPACEVLEEALADYDGTLLVISHDRFFLDAVCNRILQVFGPDGGGRVEVHAGNYSDWKTREKQLAVEARERVKEKETSRKTEKSGKPIGASVTAANPSSLGASSGASSGGDAAGQDSESDKRARMQDREQKKQADRERQRKERRFAELEKLIADGEAKLEETRGLLAAEHGGDWQRLNGLVAEERQLAAKVSSLLGEWEKLGEELI